MNNPYYELGNGKQIKDINHFLAAHISNTFEYLFRAGRKKDNDFDAEIQKVMDNVAYEIERQKIYPCPPTLQSAFLYRKELSDMLFTAMNKIENQFAKKVFKFLYEYVMYERRSSLKSAYALLVSYFKKDFVYIDMYSSYVFKEPLK